MVLPAAAGTASAGVTAAKGSSRETSAAETTASASEHTAQNSTRGCGSQSTVILLAGDAETFLGVVPAVAAIVQVDTFTLDAGSGLAQDTTL